MGSPIIGYGARDVAWMVYQIGGSGPHNIWLMILLEGGVVSLSILVGLFVKLLRKAEQCRNFIGSHTAVCLAVLLLMSLFETYYIICIFFIMVIAYYALHLEKETKAIEPDKAEEPKDPIEIEEPIARKVS